MLVATPLAAIVILNNFFGRQFNSLNDVALHRKTGELFFTDPDYGNNQGFRPTPGLPFQVYRWNETTGAFWLVRTVQLRADTTWEPDPFFDLGVDRLGIDRRGWIWKTQRDRLFAG
jgi:hypothetical protein